MLANQIGYYSLIIGLLCSLYLCGASIKDFNNNNKIINPNIISLSFLQLTLVIISFLSLIFSFINSDFSNETVFNNSHTTKPLFYKISGTWGNHEGSLLLWLLVLTLFIFLFLTKSREQPKKYRILTLLFQQLIIIGFFLFVLITSNPFNYLFPIPSEGLGLNPILQDPALAIHPPLLYLGYVGSSIIFSASLAAVIQNYISKEWGQHIKKWVLISWIFLTIGIMLGSIWAYYELGWGGFWFWDPVENASLMPWFVMTALMHSCIVLEKRNILYPWVVILCLSTFTLSVTGTFLVRSGILNSVHTFANDPSRGLYILIFLSLMIFSALVIFLKNYKKEYYNFNANSKETFILANNWFMAFFLITVLIGTIFPIFTEVLNNVKISVGAPFYNIVIIPVVVPFLVLMAIAPSVKWIRHIFKKSYKFLLIAVLAVLVNVLILYFFKSYSLLSNLIIISSIFLILYSLIDLIKYFRTKISFDLSRVISHLGFGLLVFFIGINHNFSLEKDFNIKEGEKRNFENYSISFESLKKEERKNYKTIIGTFNVFDKNKLSSKILSPEIRIYSNPSTLTYESSIRSRLSHDLYLTMSNINRSDFCRKRRNRKVMAFAILFYPPHGDSISN